ncbi:putative ferric-chelate reductase 1 [Rhopilema esculentum]|uniref:putative ferric-chelate reductase 1 n=1 Tax=Rhopilema esculentum TaxID=499914 RepID=UPI0031CF9C5C
MVHGLGSWLATTTVTKQWEQQQQYHRRKGKCHSNDNQKRMQLWTRRLGKKRIKFTDLSPEMINHIVRFFIFTLVIIKVEGIKNSDSATPACGSVTGCLVWPPNCSSLNCKVVLEFFHENQSKFINIMMSVKSSDWVAFGYNMSPRMMGGTVGQICMKRQSKEPILKSFENEGTDFNMKELAGQIKPYPTVTSNVNGWLICRFKTPLQGASLPDLTKPWYIIASWGETKMKGSKIHAKEHGTGDYFWTSSKVIVTEKHSFRVSTFGWGLIAAHGSLMVLAWIGFAFSGIFFARYMRGSLQGKKVCGMNWWFQFHRIAMFCSTVLVIIAFIIILVEAKGWNTEMDAHPILGIITIILVVLQTAAGMLRPAVNSSRRYMFNIFHRLNGAVTYILAMVTIFLGLAAMEVDFAVLILYLVIILIAFVGFGGYQFYKSRIVTEVPYQESELDSHDGSNASDDLPSSAIMSSKELFIFKISGGMVVALGFGIALVLISLIGHKGYVYAKKQHV